MVHIRSEVESTAKRSCATEADANEESITLVDRGLTRVILTVIDPEATTNEREKLQKNML